MIHKVKSVQPANPRMEERYAAIIQDVTVNGSLMYAGKLLQNAARKFATNNALLYKNESITYKELYNRACAITKLLVSRGIKPRDRVLVWFENDPDFYSAYYGAWQIGAVVVPVNLFMHTVEFMHVVKDSQASAIIVSDALFEKLKDIPQDQLPLVIKQSELENYDHNGSYDVEVPSFPADELAVLLYTSGTTGLPKGVMLSSRNILTNLAQGLSFLDVTSKERILGVLPLFHSFAQLTCVWAPMIAGATIILVPRIERHYIVEGLLHRPTFVLGVPALFGLFCLMKTASFPDVRYFISGGDALPDKIRSAFSLIYRRKLASGYGLTETSPVVAVCLDDELMNADTVGYPVKGIQCSLRGDEGKEVGDNEVGVLWLKGDNVMMGYYNAQHHTDEVIKDGWFNTGDLATFDAKGRLRIVGREKDLIINKGFNIYPQEIENILMGHPQVIRAGVVGIDDPEVGQVPVAFVEIRDYVEGIERQLKSLCMQHLAPYKIPKKFEIVKEMPVTSIGKIDKKRIRREYKLTD
jgi:long-chain acyl-CoA synthetase